MKTKLKSIASLLLGILGILAYLSYHASDPSFNTVSDQRSVHNLLGLPGAYLADFLWQGFGYIGFLLPLSFVVFGVLVWFQVPRVKARIYLFLPAVLLACWLAASIELPLMAWERTLIHAGRGGFLGFFLARWGILPIWYIQAALWLIVFCLLIFSFKVPTIKLLSWCGHGGFWLGKHLVSLCPQYHRKKTQQPSTTPRLIKKKEPVEKASRSKAPPAASSDKLSGGTSSEGKNSFTLPSATLLTPPKTTGATISKETMIRISEALEGVLQQFGINGHIVGANPGPVVTLYEFVPASGVKTSRVISLADDIAREMSAISVRIAVVPGSNTIGIEMPNPTRDIVYIRDLIEQPKFQANTGALPLILGKDIGGVPIYADLAKMPHLLVAGTTGSGKSVAINTMILSLLYRFTPAECRLILVDPKMVELSVYNDIPHLLTPVVTEAPKAVMALKWAVREMEDRYRAMSQLNVRNIDGYNQKLIQVAKEGTVLTRRVQTGFDPETGKPIIEEQPFDLTPIPYIVMIVDEMADLMGQCGKEAEPPIQRLAQMARAVGIHLILATQRPSVDVITGIIKANFPTRISFQVTNKIDSRTILDEQGAEQLLGKGDMLYRPAGQKPQRIHGPFVSDSEVERVVKFWAAQGSPSYVDAVISETADGLSGTPGAGGSRATEGGAGDLYDQAVAIVLRDKKVSTSYVQRRLSIGYNRAADLIERMEREGIISPANATGKREILVPTDNA